MKRHSTLDVTSGDQLKVKRRTIIQTRKTLSQQDESDDEEVEILAIHHVTIKELDEEEPFEDEVHDASAALEDGGQVTVDELKELNLGTNEDPRPIFVSALLNPSEEESYHQLLLEYKDVFAWRIRRCQASIQKLRSITLQSNLERVQSNKLNVASFRSS
ncbi:hypothetical protein L3X38_037303 [Prunus dulcis]|uniref:Uncharacterized protein n=1 Tax=Prunus dulcis TaxID=3755 RepID=A0AAD4V4Y4_PRUDU|nr:hypothetical protein L3X38_037303 [Prunus dulcis]